MLNWGELEGLSPRFHVRKARAKLTRPTLNSLWKGPLSPRWRGAPDVHAFYQHFCRFLLSGGTSARPQYVLRNFAKGSRHQVACNSRTTSHSPNTRRPAALSPSSQNFAWLHPLRPSLREGSFSQSNKCSYYY